jgi:predicted short-subunit dehydrogenase-like oxidoreductase (DUF2520 family)
VPSNILDSSVSVFGPGRAAQAFARSWILAGGRVADILGRDPAKVSRAASQIGGGRPGSAGPGHFACDLLVVGVPDDAIRSVAERLGRQMTCRFAFHFSGALTAEELAPLRARGAAVGSMHPARAFSGSPAENWNGALVAIEGDEKAVGTGELVAAAVGAKGHRIAPHGKPLYHAAATLAAGGSLALVSMAARAWASLGIPETDARAALADLAARATAAAARGGFEEVFTGPIARRDVGTVRAHWTALASRPEVLAVYAALARETLDRTPGRGKEEEILAILAGPDG